MVWLAVRGYRVVGSELSALAVEEFFGEQQRPDVAVEPEGTFHRHVQARSRSCRAMRCN